MSAGAAPDLTAAADTRQWVDDGHEITVTTDFGRAEAGVYCPHARRGWSAMPWADRPPCRRATREDGTPDEQWDGGACLFDEYLTDGRVDDDAPSSLVRRRVAFAWSGVDGDTVSVRQDDGVVTPDLTAAQVQRELFEQSLRADLAGRVGMLDDVTARIMANPHLAGWIEAERVAERSVERRRLADLFEQNRDAIAGFAGDKDRLVELISHLLRLPSKADR